MSRTIIRNITVSDDPILAANEMGYDSINKLLKIGNGTSKWSQLSAIQTGGSEEMAIIITGGVKPSTTTTLVIDGYECTSMPKAAFVHFGGGQNALSTASEIKPLTILLIDGDCTTGSVNASNKWQPSSLTAEIKDKHLTFTSINALTFSTSDQYYYKLIY